MGEKKTVFKCLGLCHSLGSNTAEIDVDGDKIVRTRPFHYYQSYDKESLRPWSIKVGDEVFECAEKSELPPLALVYKKRYDSPNRIPYPLKRVDWDPNGERHPEMRGESKYERISWDEATTIIASEIRRVIDTYGPHSILLQCDGHGETKSYQGSHSTMRRLAAALGGLAFQSRNSDSWEGWCWGAKHMWGQAPIGQGTQANLLYDVAHNADTLLVWGGDYETTPWGWGGQLPGRYSFFLSRIGVRHIFVCPDVNYAAAVHADRWIPILPNTDSAMQLAIAYTWITEGTYDREYIDSHSVGFEWFEYYVLGGEDGEPKTPEWAEGKCGVPARIIKALARHWAKRNVTIAHCNGGSYIRSCFAHEPARLEVALLAMQALGHPGRNQLKFIEWGLYNLDSQNAAPRPEFHPNNGGVKQTSHGLLNETPFIPKTLIPEAILGHYTGDNPLTWYGTTQSGAPAHDQFIKYSYPWKGEEPIHMIWSDSPCWETCWNEGNKFSQALRDPSIEFVYVQHPWFENACSLADIILPSNTIFESTDIMTDVCSGDWQIYYHEDQAVTPYGESRSDFYCTKAIAEKLGMEEAHTLGLTDEEWFKKGFDASGCQDYMSYEEFMEKKYCVAPVVEGWEKDPAGFYEFYVDPEGHPLSTPTGKIEFYSAYLQEYFPDDKERGPYPRWVETGPTHPSERLNTPRAEKYPFLLVSNHPRWRVHANMDDSPWLREMPTCKVVGPDGYAYEPVWINPVDAEKLGIESGDVVKLFNERGWVLGGAYVTERIMPNALSQDHGARLDPIVRGESDRGGANNLICPSAVTSQHCAGEVTSGFLVGIEKVDVFELAAQYPEAFNRQRDEEYGNIVEAWLA